MEKDELRFIIPNGLGHPDGEVIFSARECGNLGVLVSDGPTWEGTGSQHLTTDQTRALFRYLAGVVLPRVERVENVADNVSIDLIEPRSALWARVYNYGSIRCTGSICCSPLEARALAACLLAAADESEGVAS